MVKLGLSQKCKDSLTLENLRCNLPYKYIKGYAHFNI